MLIALGLPVLVLMIAAVLVTRAVERVVPEHLGGLVAAAVLSSVVLWGLSAAGFALLYQLQGAPLAALIGTSAEAGARHFALLGAKAALIWGPLVALTVATAPRRWKTAVW